MESKAMKLNSGIRNLLFFGVALMATVPASAAIRVVGRFGYPGFYPYGYYDPYFYGGYPVVSHPNAGQVKLDTKVKDAEVFVDGAYAGKSGELKSLWLHQGSYTVEVRKPGKAEFKEKIYVVNGKTLHIHPDLQNMAG